MAWMITNFEPIDDPETMEDGKRVLARFDLVLPDIVIGRCAILHRQDKGWTIWGPSYHVKLARRLSREVRAELRKMLID